MDFLRALITAPVSITVLFLLSKFIGNKQMSSLNLFDYINGITIGSIAAEMATAENVRLLGVSCGTHCLCNNCYALFVAFTKINNVTKIFNRQVYCDFRQRKVVQKEFFGCKN